MQNDANDKWSKKILPLTILFVALMILRAKRFGKDSKAEKTSKTKHTVILATQFANSTYAAS